MYSGVELLFDLTHCITILDTSAEFGFFFPFLKLFRFKILYFYLDFLQEYFNGVFKAKKVVCNDPFIISLHQFPIPLPQKNIVFA